jgi:hypothetical protein
MALENQSSGRLDEAIEAETRRLIEKRTPK